MAKRTCAAADRTGHAILHTLHQQCLKHDTEFFVEYVTLDLLMDEDGTCRGLLAWNMDDGTLPGSMPIAQSWQPAATVESISLALPPIPVPVMATRWRCAPEYRSKTWNLPNCKSAPNQDPARDWSYQIDSKPIISVLVGSLSVPIGTLLFSGFSTSNQGGNPRWSGVPVRC